MRQLLKPAAGASSLNHPMLVRQIKEMPFRQISSGMIFSKALRCFFKPFLCPVKQLVLMAWHPPSLKTGLAGFYFFWNKSSGLNLAGVLVET